MYNPSYLSKSRHDIFYFRYPIGKNRISLSLRTRCPKEALRLAKALAYHGENIITGMYSKSMDYAEIKAMVETSFAKELARQKAMIDRSGPMPEAVRQRLQNAADGIGQQLEAKELPDDFPDDNDIAGIVKE